MKIESVQNARI